MTHIYVWLGYKLEFPKDLLPLGYNYLLEQIMELGEVLT